MSKQQYNLTTKTDYLNRKMFLDPAGPVTIQRFEEVKYNKLAGFETTARGFFWVPEEVSLTKDAQDFKIQKSIFIEYSNNIFYSLLCKFVYAIDKSEQIFKRLLHISSISYWICKFDLTRI